MSWSRAFSSFFSSSPFFSYEDLQNATKREKSHKKNALPKRMEGQKIHLYQYEKKKLRNQTLYSHNTLTVRPDFIRHLH